MSTQSPYDVVIIGGGVNGCGIARDAAGRGLSVLLCEKDDLAQATSSASTKLFHGGLRYLEYYEFRLVREALIEREVLLRAMPHISWPMRFVLPHHSGLRPSWLLRLVVSIRPFGWPKDPATDKALNLRTHETGRPLKACTPRVWDSDCWVEDSRLVVLNARDTEARGATIKTRTRVEGARRDNDLWTVDLQDTWSGDTAKFRQEQSSTAAPWVSEILHDRIHEHSKDEVRLVRVAIL